jgi:hypothetical protein
MKCAVPAHRENRTLSETDVTVTSSVLRLPFVKSGADRRDIFANAVREDALPSIGKAGMTGAREHQ